jgi:hypothetical protein
MTQLPVMPSDNIYPHLWQRGPIEVRSKPLYHFHLSVLFNGEVHGDCPTQTFVGSPEDGSSPAILLANQTSNRFSPRSTTSL